MDPLIVLIPLVFAVVFPAFWSAIVWLVGQFGWARLARHYATDAPRTGRTFRMETGQIGGANYSSSLTVSVEPDGLRLAVMPLFRPGHPPVLIPWEEIGSIRPKRFLWHTNYEIETAPPDPIKVRLSKRVVEAIREEGDRQGGLEVPDAEPVGDLGPRRTRTRA